MLLAFAWVNSPAVEIYDLIHHTPLSLQVGAVGLSKPLVDWINEGLMVFFFFAIGLEIKREVLVGDLASPRKIALPGIGALGGMLVPAAVYLLFNAGNPETEHGWAVPVATDIVLALAVLSVLGTRIPPTLKVFLMALAVFDDFGTLEVGKLADILMFGADPLTDISNIRKLEVVMKEGQTIDIGSLPTNPVTGGW